MVRLLDLPAALHMRGYPPSVEARLELDVYDDLFEENSGRWLLDISGGKAEVQRGGAGTVRADIRGLAAAFTGFASATTLLGAGLIEAEPADAAVLDVIFAGASPWMPEQF